ncbi:hypothetical protein BC831DRAFT_293252 [Entophlyctis helioformis]|nr:hypothetical protein BC831DRAFT_293252 [Entophlyctis helioformis]
MWSFVSMSVMASRFGVSGNGDFCARRCSGLARRAGREWTDRQLDRCRHCSHRSWIHSSHTGEYAAIKDDKAWFGECPLLQWLAWDAMAAVLVACLGSRMMDGIQSQEQNRRWIRCAMSDEANNRWQLRSAISSTRGMDKHGCGDMMGCLNGASPCICNAADGSVDTQQHRWVPDRRNERINCTACCETSRRMSRMQTDTKAGCAWIMLNSKQHLTGSTWHASTRFAESASLVQTTLLLASPTAQLLDCEPGRSILILTADDSLIVHKRQ